MISRVKRSLKRAAKRLFSAVGLDVRRAAPSRKTVSKPPRTRPGVVPSQPTSTDNLYEAVDFLRSRAVDELNETVRQRITAEVRAGRPPRIGFVVNDRTKWNADSLLEEMRRLGWTTRLYLCPKQASYLDVDDKNAAYRTEREFFSQIDGELVDLYDPDRGSDRPIEEWVQSDVVFLQQPWGMQQFPRRLAGRSLSAYMHYGFVLMGNHDQHYQIGSFHPYLWRYFAQTEEHRLLHLRHDPAAYPKLVVTGYPKLDVYLSENGDGKEVWPDPQADHSRIVYAPHHSLSKGSLRMSTFAWNHDFMLDLARNSPTTQWVYKPHPNLKYTVVRNRLMTRAEYLRYEQAWAELPNATVYDSGRYFELFRSSDALITDCGSFLAEYLPAGKPIIWLVSPTSVGLNSVGESLSGAFYQARSVEELRELFQRVIVAGDDPLQKERMQAVERLFPTNGTAASAVVEQLRRELAVEPASGQDPS